MAVILGDAMATGEALGALDAILLNDGPSDTPATQLDATAEGAVPASAAVDGAEDVVSDVEPTTAGADGSMDKASRRAALLYRLKKNRKRKLTSQDDAVRELQVEATAAIKSISASLSSLVDLMAARAHPVAGPPVDA
jgi:hypothetical protein